MHALASLGLLAAVPNSQLFAQYLKSEETTLQSVMRCADHHVRQRAW
jgi:hypothetical protein